MQNNQTDPDLQCAMLQHLTAWSLGTPLHPLTPQSGALTHTIYEQDCIGWTNRFEGCPAQGWAEVQEMYYHSIASQQSGFQWMVALIKKTVGYSLGLVGAMQWLPT